MRTCLRLLWCLVVLGAPLGAAAQPSAREILKRADAILAPDEYEASLTFATRRGQDQIRTFSLQVRKKGTDKLRVRFLAPADDRGNEFLRVGDNMWHYLHNLKRALKISAKQEFHGGDFANSDVLRVNLSEDYDPTLLPSPRPDEWLLELRAKSDAVAYHRIKFALRKKDFMPLRQEFFTASGKLVRKLEMSQLKTYGKLVRPSRFVMRNMLVPSRVSEMTWDALTVRRGLDPAGFDLAALGR